MICFLEKYALRKAGLLLGSTTRRDFDQRVIRKAICQSREPRDGIVRSKAPTATSFRRFERFFEPALLVNDVGVC